MTWSGKDTLLAEFLPKFADRERCLNSVREYITGSRVLDDQRARLWLGKDLERDQELAALARASAEPPASHFQLNGCSHCAGKGMVRLEHSPGEPDFGKVSPCPACAGRSHPEQHCDKCARANRALEQPERTQCWKCGKFQDEPSAEHCSNPRWHYPNWQLPDPPDGRRDYVAELAGHMRTA